MDTVGNVNNVVSIYGIFIYDSSYNKVVCLLGELLDHICYSSYHDDMYEDLKEFLM